jgi:hypothetical protein
MSRVGGHSRTAKTTWLRLDQPSTNGRLQRDASGRAGADDEELRQTPLSSDRDRKALVDVSIANASENLPIVSEANTENSRFAPERAFGPLHRFGDLRDRYSSFRMRFDFLDVFF